MDRLRRSSHTVVFAVLVIAILGLCLVNPESGISVFGGLGQS